MPQPSATTFYERINLAGACQHRMVLPDDELHLVALLSGIYLNEVIVVFCN